MKIVNLLLQLFKKPSPKSFVRWSASELAEKKSYLEEKDPRSWNKEDHYLAVEWVCQRYLPRDENPSHEQWQKMLRDMRAKIDRNISLSDSGQPLPAYDEEKHYDPEFQKVLEDILSK